MAGVLLIALFALLARPAQAQDDGVTFDEVNAIAAKLYCPVCENVPLVSCPTEACVRWRGEIRIQLEEGRTEQQIIDDFVQRFGDIAVGTPQDPFLRALSLVTPVLLAGVAALGAGLTFLRWNRRGVFAAMRAANRNGSAAPSEVETVSDEEYRRRIERDLKEKQ